MINVKDLALINPGDSMSLEEFRTCYKTDVLFVPQDLSIIKLLQEFIKGKNLLLLLLTYYGSYYYSNSFTL